MKYLVVVDMQKDFVDGSLGTDEAVKILPVVCDKIKEYEGENIFVTLDTHYENYLETAEGKKLPVSHCIKGTDGWALDENIRLALDGNGKYYEKNTFGSVKLAEDLSRLLKDGDTVELCGLCTDICVVSNALMIKAFSPQTQIMVDEKCCAGVTPQAHQAAISTMRSCQIDIV